jgi:hypothetical protein
MGTRYRAEGSLSPSGRLRTAKIVGDCPAVGMPTLDWREKMQAYICLFLILTFGLCGSGSAHSQEIVVSGPVPKCEDCLKPMLTTVLGDSGDSLSLGGLPRVLRGSNRYFAIAGENQPSTILLYSYQGDLQANLGRKGEGPGEVRRVWSLSPGQGDSVLVGEMGNRLHFFSGDGNFGRTLSLYPMGTQAVQFPGGDLMVNASVMTRAGIGLPLQVFSSDGEKKAAFGDDNPVLPWRPASRMRVIAAATDSSAWAVQPDLYVLQEWSKTGSRLRTVRREVEWFPEPSVREERPNPAFQRPAPAVSALLQDGNFLWVALQVADAEWVPIRQEGLGNAAPATPETLNRIWDTVIEVIDLRDGSLFAWARIDAFVRGFTAPGEVYTLREDSAGMLFIDLWTLSLEVRNPKPIQELMP